MLQQNYLNMTYDYSTLIQIKDTQCNPDYPNNSQIKEMARLCRICGIRRLSDSDKPACTDISNTGYTTWWHECSKCDLINASILLLNIF